jgi:hypothetical protein
MALYKTVQGKLKKSLETVYTPKVSLNPINLSQTDLKGMTGADLVIYYKALCKFVIELDKMGWHVRVAPDLLYPDVLTLVDTVYNGATAEERNTVKKLAILTSAHFEKKEYLRLDTQVRAQTYTAKRKDLAFSMVDYDKPYDFIRLVLDKK